MTKRSNTETVPFEKFANETVANPATSYTCFWCRAFNRAGCFCGCGASRKAHGREVGPSVDINSITLTF